MARPTKQGIDYFPLDCQFDDKIEMYLIEKEANGLAVLISIWQIIYSNDGYYTPNGNDLCLLIKKRINVNINEIKECINVCLSRNIFDSKLHKKHKILTSKAIQKRYFDAAKKKKIVQYNIDYVINGINTPDNSIDVGGNATNVKENVKENVSTHPIQKFVKTLKRVSKLGDQLTFEQCEKLMKDYELLDIKETLESMENWKPLTKSRCVVNSTLRNWLNRDNKKKVSQ